VQIRFAEFVLDLQRRQLVREDKAVHLTPKAFELLSILAERRPEAVAKGELEAQIWGKTHVAETSLAGLVAELRSALGDEVRGSRYIRTVHGFGYAFCAVAEAVRPGGGTPGPEQVEYRVAWERREVSLRAGENVLGRDADAVAWLDSPTVSRRHARILVSRDGALVEDLGSHNGTFVQGRKVESPVRLQDRDEIRLGSVVVTFRIYASGETESEAG
jgi:DNA-binding winged helix-turn-helix (wHTH) protein